MHDPRPLHVVPHGDAWATVREGAARPTSIHYTRASAERTGRAFARDHHVELVLHARDGEIRAREAPGLVAELVPDLGATRPVR